LNFLTEAHIVIIGNYMDVTKEQKRRWRMGIRMVWSCGLRAGIRESGRNQSTPEQSIHFPLITCIPRFDAIDYRFSFSAFCSWKLSDSHFLLLATPLGSGTSSTLCILMHFLCPANEVGIHRGQNRETHTGTAGKTTSSIPCPLPKPKQ